jgi:hypothetical protein
MPTNSHIQLGTSCRAENETLSEYATLWRGLEYLLHPSICSYDLSPSRRGAATYNSAPYANTRYGMVPSCNGTGGGGSNVDTGTLIHSLIGKPFSLVVWYDTLGATPASQDSLLGAQESSGASQIWLRFDSSTKFKLQTKNDGGALGVRNITPDVASVVGLHAIALSLDSPNGASGNSAIDWWFDGGLLAAGTEQTKNAVPAISPTESLLLAAKNSGGTADKEAPMAVIAFAFWSRLLNDSEGRLVTTDPFAVVRPLS